jgi:transcriptional regulator with XRE-family HTH domain
MPKELKDDELVWLREVGMRVRLARVRRRLTQREAAAAAGISAVTFSSVERADHVAGVLSYIWIARALELSLSELLDGAP